MFWNIFGINDLSKIGIIESHRYKMAPSKCNSPQDLPFTFHSLLELFQDIRNFPDNSTLFPNRNFLFSTLLQYS